MAGTTYAAGLFQLPFHTRRRLLVFDFKFVQFWL
jgi:hypothetical protein